MLPRLRPKADRWPPRASKDAMLCQKHHTRRRSTITEKYRERSGVDLSWERVSDEIGDRDLKPVHAVDGLCPVVVDKQRDDRDMVTLKIYALASAMCVAPRHARKVRQALTQENIEITISAKGGFANHACSAGCRWPHIRRHGTHGPHRHAGRVARSRRCQLADWW